MKEKIVVGGSNCFHNVLPLGCWTPYQNKKQCVGRWLLKRYQKVIDFILAASAVGLMLLAGIWMFLVELADIGLSY